MKEQGTHEGCIEQIYRLYTEYLYAKHPKSKDEEGYIRLDDYEMNDKIQQKIRELWPQVTSENINELTDIKGYCNEFYRLFGFNLAGIDYQKEVDPNVKIPSLIKDSIS
jgi:enoyl-[acyl-carrier protein] reductase/trans-2-enoyl-CoA reductase (NAD+)